ncbi:hypothetical protein K469DRAFT_683670 [Zopfia rhizophila CBS 207.26]|uniref:Methyltransferase n=1 Tax=Zopfia rhizophila CBS 207.26 TaxID=1314779 RepID=A0A6A6EB77_9PEZI|nr:hypothetical protein K469DRAFT_683670 [Zopfia rhizophila CBS 207.26]
MSSTSRDVKSSIYFLSRDRLYETVKPYSLRFAPERIPQTNLKPEKHSVYIRDLREASKEEKIDFNSCGFGVLHMDSSLTYKDFFCRDIVESIYYFEVEEMLKAVFNAKSVYVLDHALRIRHGQFPTSTGENYDYEQPTSLAHVDFTRDSARDASCQFLDLEAKSLLDASWKCVNVWKPLKGPVRDWPLALCSVTSMDFEKDSIPGDVVSQCGPIEDIHIHYNPTQKWYYLSDQEPSELLIFRSSDSEGNLGAPHASFPLPRSMSDETPRESIDLRAFLFF